MATLKRQHGLAGFISARLGRPFRCCEISKIGDLLNAKRDRVGGPSDNCSYFHFSGWEWKRCQKAAMERSGMKRSAMKRLAEERPAKGSEAAKAAKSSGLTSGEIGGKASEQVSESAERRGRGAGGARSAELCQRRGEQRGELLLSGFVQLFSRSREIKDVDGHLAFGVDEGDFDVAAGFGKTLGDFTE